MKKTTLLLFFFFSILSQAQEKKIWAKSFINKQAPKLVIEEWISNKPNSTDGKFILIDFWATWCGPCKRAISKLNSFQKEFKDDLIIIGISDEPKYIVENQTNPAIEYYNAIDTRKRLKNIYEVTGIPHCVIINPEGIVVWEGFPYLGGNELTSEVINNLIKKTPQINITDYSNYSIAELNSKKTELELKANYILVNDYLEKIEREEINHMTLTKIDKGIVTWYWDNIAELKSYYNNWKEASSKISAFEKKQAPELTELSSLFKNGTIEEAVYFQQNREIRAKLRTIYPNEYSQLSENHIYSLKTLWKTTGRYMLEDYKRKEKVFPIYWIPEKDRIVSESANKYKAIDQELIVIKNEIKRKI